MKLIGKSKYVGKVTTTESYAALSHAEKVKYQIRCIE